MFDVYESRPRDRDVRAPARWAGIRTDAGDGGTCNTRCVREVRRDAPNARPPRGGDVEIERPRARCDAGGGGGLGGRDHDHVGSANGRVGPVTLPDYDG